MRLRYADYLYSGFTAAAQKGVLVTTQVLLPDEVLQRNETYTGLDLKKQAYPEVSAMNGDELRLATDVARSKKGGVVVAQS